MLSLEWNMKALICLRPAFNLLGAFLLLVSVALVLAVVAELLMRCS